GVAGRRRLRPAFGHEEDRRRAEDEAADVGEEGRPTAGARLHERDRARPELERDPDAEEPDRRDLADQDDPEEDHREYAGAGEKHEVRAEDAGDRAAR